jgi:hypothetical protein
VDCCDDDACCCCCDRRPLAGYSVPALCDQDEDFQESDQTKVLHPILFYETAAVDTLFYFIDCISFVLLFLIHCRNRKRETYHLYWGFGTRTDSYFFS